MEKRKRPIPENHRAKSKKKQKLEARPIPGIPKLKEQAGRVVRLDNLEWKDVDMPDRLDDYEGFFGLEEIDDVEVVKDEESGRVSFRDLKAERHDLKTVDDAGHVNNIGDIEEEEEEWAGFSDEEESQGNPVALRQDKTLNAVDAPDGVEDASEATTEEGETEVPEQEGFRIGKKEKKKVAEAGKKQSEQNLKGKKPNVPTSVSAFDSLNDAALEDDEEVHVAEWLPLDLSPEINLSLSKLRFSQPTPIQRAAIPEIIAGHDVIGKASTGSGKTLAFGIPILEQYLRLQGDKNGNQKKHEPTKPFALILSPTRELAHQISEHLENLVSHADLERPRIATLTGGLSIHKQQRVLAIADIVVGTPGRVWEIISEGKGTVSWIQSIAFLVVDEADRLLSQGHFKELEEILNALDAVNTDEEGNATTRTNDTRQTLVFSATFHKGLQQKLASKKQMVGGDVMSTSESMEYLLKKLNFKGEKPKFIDVNPISQMAANLREGLVECGATEKDLYLYALLLYHPNKRTLVFTNSISAVRRLTPFLQNLNIKALALHSSMPQKARLRSVERFTAQPGSILVATDVAARGLDIPGVELVLHYHLPRAADMYVHRSGRTARADASGSSILICAPEEVNGVRRLIAKVHAQAQSSGSSKKSAAMRTIDIDRRIVAKLKPRTTLAKQLADTTIAKEKKHTENDWMREAAEDLGVEYDSEDFDGGSAGRQGRGNKRKKMEREARSLTKAEVQGMRAELKALLAQRVNVGVSERYLTSGRVDVDALLRGEQSEFLGHVDALDFDS